MNVRVCVYPLIVATLQEQSEWGEGWSGKGGKGGKERGRAANVAICRGQVELAWNRHVIRFNQALLPNQLQLQLNSSFNSHERADTALIELGMWSKWGPW